MDNDNVKAAPLLYGRGAEICAQGQALSCRIQCDPGTRYGIERLYGAPGVEVCAVSHCTCEQLPLQPPWLSQQPAASVQDLALPLAFVIFGAEHLLRGPR